MELTQIRIEVFGTSISHIHSWDLYLTDSQLGSPSHRFTVGALDLADSQLVGWCTWHIRF